MLPLLVGCRGMGSRSREAGKEPQADLATREKAVVREIVRIESGAGRTTYMGKGWRLEVPPDAGWRREADETSTLQLVRDEDGTRLHLRLRVYRIREGMDSRTFLAAHAMWLAEEGEPRVEYTWDDDLQAWKGYAVGAGKETYYLFRVAGDRGYVLEESAEGATLSAKAADEFQRLAAGLICGRTAGTPPRSKMGPQDTP